MLVRRPLPSEEPTLKRSSRNVSESLLVTGRTRQATPLQQPIVEARLSSGSTPRTAPRRLLTGHGTPLRAVGASGTVETKLCRPVDPLPREDIAAGTTRLRLLRGKKRQAAHGAARMETSSHLLTFLEANSIREGTAEKYTRALKDFDDWMTSGGTKFGNTEMLDALGTEYLEDLYFRGFNHEAGDTLLSALRYASPVLTSEGKGTLPRMQRSLRGFRRLAPGASRCPIPFYGMTAMVGAAFFLKLEKLGVALTVQFVGYLRPHELLSLTPRHLVAPSSFDANVWGLLLAPEELAVRSKTQVFDESVTLDWAEIPALGDRLREYRRGTEAESSIWGFDSKRFDALFATVAEASGVSVLRPHPYSLRHGGASHDYLRARRTLDAVRLRGRWRSENSVRRYLKASRAMKEEQALDVATLRYGQLIASNFDKLLARSWTAPRPPRLGGGSLLQAAPRRG